MNNDHKDKIASFYKKHKRMPVYTEMMSLLGFRSKNAVAKVINKLIDEGVLEKDSSGHLLPNMLVGDIPVLGLVEAGFPSDVNEISSDTLNIADYLIHDKECTYLLQVKGDSMIEAGIHDGDMVVAEKKNQAKDGDIVIALVDGGWTMKYYKNSKGKIYLKPANKDFKDIYPESQLEIAAIVKGVIRKYR